MNSDFVYLIVLGVIAYLVYRIFRHLVPATPPAAAGANTPPPVPVNWNERIGNFLKVVAAIAIIWLLFSGGFNSIFKGGSNSETTQSVDVRDNYGVIQQNDVDITNNNTTIVQPAQRTGRIVTQTVDDGSDGTFQRKEYTIKTIRKKYVDTNGDPQPVTISKDASVTTMLR